MNNLRADLGYPSASGDWVESIREPEISETLTFLRKCQNPRGKYRVLLTDPLPISRSAGIVQTPSLNRAPQAPAQDPNSGSNTQNSGNRSGRGVNAISNLEQDLMEIGEESNAINLLQDVDVNSIRRPADQPRRSAPTNAAGGKIVPRTIYRMDGTAITNNVAEMSGNAAEEGEDDLEVVDNGNQNVNAVTIEDTFRGGAEQQQQRQQQQQQRQPQPLQSQPRQPQPLQSQQQRQPAQQQNQRRVQFQTQS